MKKYFKMARLAATLFCLILALAACGADKTSQDSDATQKTENEQQEPSIEIGEELKWPKELMGNLPEPTGKVTAVMSDETSKQCTVTFGEMSKEDAGEYVKMVEELGYSGGLKVSDSDLISISGDDATGARVDFLYNVSPKEGIITFDPKSESQ